MESNEKRVHPFNLAPKGIPKSVLIQMGMCTAMLHIAHKSIEQNKSIHEGYKDALLLVLYKTIYNIHGICDKEEAQDDNNN